RMYLLLCLLNIRRSPNSTLFPYTTLFRSTIYTLKRCITMEELLRILEKNARMPIEDIAAMLDKTPEEVAAMMDEAAAKGYIRGYETLVDWERAGVSLVEAVIELRVTPHKSCGFDDIGAAIADFDEVDTVLLMRDRKSVG